MRKLSYCTVCFGSEKCDFESNRGQNMRLDSACRMAGTGRVHFQQVQKEVSRIPCPQSVNKRSVNAMRWISQCLHAVKAHLQCAKTAKPLNVKTPPGFDSYQVIPIYLGYKGELRTDNLRLELSYSARDGIFVNIKSLAPWKVFFEYADGNCMINDEAAQYSDLLASLNQLRENEKEQDDLEVYKRLEEIVLTNFANRKRT